MGERIALGFIGLGAHGLRTNLKFFLWQPDAHVAALCDVDAQRLREAERLTNEYYESTRGKRETYRGCFTTGDWREIIARDDIDAVVISTPDHWHVLPALAAVRAGKDVFCEKPLSLTVEEGRILSDAVTQHGRVSMTASSNRSKLPYVQACELVRNGRIGKLRHIRCELPRGYDIQGDYGSSMPEAGPVPAWFDYDMWLGQAPYAPYTPGRCHWNFRWILDYAGGHLTDWGAHMLDIAQWGHDTERTCPVKVKGQGVFPDHGLYNAATDWDIEYEYADGVTLRCTSREPGLWFEGDDGWIFCTWKEIDASKREILDEPLGEKAVRLRTCPNGEQRDFLDCVRTRAETYAPVEIGHRSITIAHLGNIAMMLGRELEWDPTQERFKDDTAANALLNRPMRAPWTLADCGM